MSATGAAGLRRADEAGIAEAARALLAGRLVVFPTETVYGLGADAASAEAIAAVYRLKGRPAGHPLIVHVSGARQARRWAVWSDLAERLTAAFWPGPLTLILPRLPGAPAWACGEQATIGLRAPAHPVAQTLLQAFEAGGGLGVAAPSANRFGRVSPTRASHAIDDLGDEAPLVLDGGSCDLGLESTIIDLSRGGPALLRPGGLDAARIEAVLGMPLAGAGSDAPRASGTLAAHYAPRTPMELLAADRIEPRLAVLAARGRRSVVWSRLRPGLAAQSGPADPAGPAVVWERAPDDVADYAHCLYDSLRRLDSLGLDRIVVERPPDEPAWAAVADRLARAAAGAPAQDP
ncbi:MAG: L-threonylcarbamoyladenylate synthase [Burkholderiaceae bacterium]